MYEMYVLNIVFENCMWKLNIVFEIVLYVNTALLYVKIEHCIWKLYLCETLN